MTEFEQFYVTGMVLAVVWALFALLFGHDFEQVIMTTIFVGLTPFVNVYVFGFILITSFVLFLADPSDFLRDFSAWDDDKPIRRNHGRKRTPPKHKRVKKRKR